MVVFRECQGRDFVQVNPQYSDLLRDHLRPDIRLQFATPFHAISDYKSGDPQVTNNSPWLANSRIPAAENGLDSIHNRPRRSGIPLDPETSVENRRAATRLRLVPANGDLLISEDAFQYLLRLAQ